MKKNTQIEHNKTNNRLHIQLKRTVEVKLYSVIAKLIFLRERRDLANLLNTIGNNSTNRDSVPKRLEDYFIKEKLLDGDSKQLTPKGKKVAETNKMSIEERGLYHIWFCVNDELLQTRPLILQRNSAYSEYKGSVWREGVVAKKFCEVKNAIDIVLHEERYGDTKDQALTLKLEDLNLEVISTQENLASLKLDWQLQFEKSDITLDGELNIKSFEYTKKGQSKPTLPKPKPIKLKLSEYQESITDVLESIAKDEKIKGMWDAEKKRLQLKFTSPTIEGLITKQPNFIKDFVIEKTTFPKFNIPVAGTFDSVEVTNLPLMPESKEDAEDWREHWLINHYKDTYQSLELSSKQQSKWIDHESINDYLLKIKLGSELLNIFKREKYPQQYWHVAAMEDLSPTLSLSKNLLMPINLINKETIQIKDFLNRLTNNSSITGFIYSDRYYKTENHKIVLKKFSQMANNVEGTLFTLHTDLDIPENWKKIEFQRKTDNHDRYWILLTKNQPYCWKNTMSLDCFKVDNS